MWFRLNSNLLTDLYLYTPTKVYKRKQCLLGNNQWVWNISPHSNLYRIHRYLAIYFMKGQRNVKKYSLVRKVSQYTTRFWRIVKKKCKNWKVGDCVKYWSWLGCCAHELILPVVTCLRTVEQPIQNCRMMGKWHKSPNSLLRSYSVYGSKGMESHFFSLV